MARLTDTVRDAAARSQRTARLPDWWIAAGGALLAVVLVVVAVGVIAPDGPPPTSLQPAAPAAPSAVPSPAPPPASTPEEESVVVPEANGRGQLTVATRLAEFGRTAVDALYRGDVAAVPAADGSRLVARGDWPDPQVSALRTASIEGLSGRLFYDLDPDGPGPRPVQRVSVLVVAQGDTLAVVAE